MNGRNISIAESRRRDHDILVDQCVIALCALRLADGSSLGKFWPQPTGAAFRPGQAMIRYGVLGGGDISGIIRGGFRAEIEIKTGKGKQRDSQINFEMMIRAFDGIYIVARSIEDAVQQTLTAAASCNS